jgi:S1-C subfamily serine protease
MSCLPPISVHSLFPISIIISLKDKSIGGRTLLKHGKVERGQLGIVVQNLTPELIQAFDIYVNQGAVVVQVLPNSAAKEDGLKVSKEVHLTLTVKNIIL